ncbi:hypothetical protein N7519_002458 [Penicillium mononematosum]|uniref:uncharacterized protein n=1 Tax=Penicillium mononematosum TaxID=268346 RepID=UPI0025472297|nr:uncharacterized protein N7519_002458 [Penicillium mononematosum]KAJ6187550.1 hypothetical protein N7519_002458 [Penicillium mononematosum]
MESTHQSDLILPHDAPTAQDPVYGTAQVVEGPPAFWANRAMACMWPRAENSTKKPSSLIYRLHKMKLRREPILRLGGDQHILNGVQFGYQVGYLLANAEALLAHAAGKKTKSSHVISCVLVPGHKHCTNCHWLGQKSRYRFLKSPRTVETTPRKKLKALRWVIKTMKKERKSLKASIKSLEREEDELTHKMKKAGQFPVAYLFANR